MRPKRRSRLPKRNSRRSCGCGHSSTDQFVAADPAEQVFAVDPAEQFVTAEPAEQYVPVDTTDEYAPGGAGRGVYEPVAQFVGAESAERYMPVAEAEQYAQVEPVPQYVREDLMFRKNLPNSSFR